MSKLLLTTGQINSLKNFVQDELLKRGFTAKITTFEEIISRGSHYINFETESFQTVPVIFKSLKVASFSTSVSQAVLENESGVTYTKTNVWITISTRTKSFDGGSNGTNLFQFNCAFLNSSEGMFETQIS